MTVESSDAVMMRHCGKVPRPTQTSVTGKVWSASVANGAGGFIGEAFSSLVDTSLVSVYTDDISVMNPLLNAPAHGPDADTCIFATAHEASAVV